MAFTDWVADEQEEIETDIETEVEDNVEETEQVEETTEATEESHTEVAQEETPATPHTYNINGQELTLEEIQTGYMRQQDYLAKIEEANKLREENKQALELVEYLRKNPTLAQKLMNEEDVTPNVSNVVNPALERVEKLERELYVNKVNAQIDGLKAKYNDFNEVEVLNRAVQMGVQDLEFVYHGMRGANMNDIIAQKVKDELAKATAEMQKNTTETRTVIGNAKHTEVSETSNLTAQQMRVADAMGISYEEYEKYM